MASAPRPPDYSPRRAPARVTFLLSLIVVLAILFVPCCLYVVLTDLQHEQEDLNRFGSHGKKAASKPLPRSFDGRADQLKRTRVVLALKEPLKPDENAVWCGTVGLAWHRFGRDVTKAPVRLRDAEQLCDWLNSEPAVELDPADYYVAAGWFKDGIVERIKQELPARFPQAPLPTQPELAPDAVALGGLAYAYLNIAFQYQVDYRDNDEPLEFVDATKNKTKVRSFGIRLKDKGQNTMRDQVKVLFRQGTEYAVDLNFLSSPYQIIVASIPLKETLAETLDELDRRSAAGPSSSLTTESVLLVPNMSWRIDRRFQELEQKRFLTPGFDLLRMEQVEQLLEFKLDRTGVKLAARFQQHGAFVNGDDHHADPNYFVFDRPFLVVLKKRDGRAFFACWVANAELLIPFE